MTSTAPEDAIITVVSGLPRSGTSMMMQMLAAGGCTILTDGIRAADLNNPQGYLEYEPVKRLPLDSTWLPVARGKAVKIVAALLPWLPLQDAAGTPLHYRVIFMKRDWQDVGNSQGRMLRNLGREHLSQPAELLERAMQQDVATARAWLSRNSVPVIDIDYQQTLADPSRTATRLAGLIPSFDAQAGADAVVAKTA
jgi:hypothetical protein